MLLQHIAHTALLRPSWSAACCLTQLILHTVAQAYGITKQRSYVVCRVGDKEQQTTVGLGEWNGHLQSLQCAESVQLAWIHCGDCSCCVGCSGHTHRDDSSSCCCGRFVATFQHCALIPNSSAASAPAAAVTADVSVARTHAWQEQCVPWLVMGVGRTMLKEQPCTRHCCVTSSLSQCPAYIQTH